MSDFELVSILTKKDLSENLQLLDQQYVLLEDRIKPGKCI